MVYLIAFAYLLIGIFVFSGWISHESKTPSGMKVLISLTWPIYLAIKIFVCIGFLFVVLFSRKKD